MTIRKFFDTDSLELRVYTLTDSSNAYLTFTDNDIIRNSIKFSGTLMKDLKSSSSTVSLSIKQNEKSNTLTAYNGELKVTLYANEIVAFKGYLSNKMSLNVNTYGIPSISITLEDVGTKLFKKELYPDSLVDHYFTGTLPSLVTLIQTQLGSLDWDSFSLSNESRSISCLISSDSTIETLLQQVCFELGYVYYWDAGILKFYKIPTSSDAEKTVTAFAAKGDNAIQVSKSIRKYKTSRITTDVYENASNVLVYRDNSGGSGSGDCKVELKGNSHYPELSDEGEPAQYDCEDIDSGKELISVSNLTPTIKVTGGNITKTIKQNGSKTITVDIANTSTATATITKLECRADVVRVKSTEIVKSTIATLSQESDNVYEAECEWIHSKEDCEYLAKVASSYFGYCDTSYKFYLIDEDATFSSSPFSYGNNLVGKVVTLKEDAISGLNVNVLVTGVTITTSTNTLEYSAVGYSKFNMSASTSSSSTGKQYISYDGAAGEAGPAGASTKAFITASAHTDSWWTTNCSVGSLSTFSNTSSLRNGCRVGDYFVITGTSTEGKTYIATFESSTDSEDLTGTCVSSVAIEKGSAGDKGDSVTTVAEYALSSSESLTEDEQAALTGWTESTELDWSYGKYIYKRIRSTVVSTSVSVIEYRGRDSSLEEAYNKRLSFSIKLDRYCYDLDKRALESSTTTIKASIEDEYYNCDSFSWYLNGDILTPTLESDGTYSFAIPVRDAETSYTLNILPSKDGNELSQISRSIILTATDKTEDCKFFGSVISLSNVAGGSILLEGDGCFLIQDDGDNAKNLVYIYDGSNWVEFNESSVDDDKKTTILAKAQKVALEYANLEGNTLSASYAYLGTLVTNYIAAKKVGAETIVLTGDNGKLVGGDYTTKDGEFLKNKGVYLDSEGTALFNDAKLKNCTISSGTIKDITITGVVDNDVLTTTLKDVAADPVSSNVTYTGNAYLTSEVVPYIKKNIATNTDTRYDYSGSIEGTSFSGIVNSAGSYISSVSTSRSNVIYNIRYPWDYAAVNDSTAFASYNGYIYRSDSSGWISGANRVIRNTSSGYVATTSLLTMRNAGEIIVGKMNGYDVALMYTDYTSRQDPNAGTDMNSVNGNSPAYKLFAFDSSGNQVEETISNISFDVTGARVIGWSGVLIDNALITAKESYKDGTYYVYLTCMQVNPGTGSSPWKPYNSWKSAASICMYTGTTAAELPVGIAKFKGKLYCGKIGDYTSGSYMRTDAYSSVGESYGQSWETITTSWSSKNGSGHRWVNFYNLDDDDSALFAVVGAPIDYSGVTASATGSTASSGGGRITSDNRQLYRSTDGVNWTLCTTSGTTTASWAAQNPVKWNGVYFYDRYLSYDGINWIYRTDSGAYQTGRARATSSYIYTSGSGGYPSVIKVTPTYLSNGLHFLDSSNASVKNESSITSKLSTDTITISNGSTSLLNLPTTIPSSMTTYTRIANVFDSTNSYYTVASASLNSYSRWNSSTNTTVTVPAYAGTPGSVDISPSVFRIDGTDYINNSWWVKSGTTISATFTPNATIKGLTTEDLNPKNADASIGNVTPYNIIRGNYIYGSSGNDLADCINVSEDMEIECGYCYCFDGTNYYKSTEYMDKKLIGVHTDTAGFYLGSSFDKKQLKIAVAGFVLAYVDKEYEIGTPLTCTSNGYLTEIKQEDKINYPERVVAVYWKPEPNEKWGRVDVNGRQWVRIR